jgi:Rad3-related DNA helicase
MLLSVADRTIELSAREFAAFTSGPAGMGSGRPGPQRAELGQVWHAELRERLAAKDPEARFEVALAALVHRGGWALRVSGRIDQVVRRGPSVVVREVKTVLRPLPVSAGDLRAEFPGHFRQLAVYQCLHRPDGAPAGPAPGASEPAAAVGELVFVEPASGVVQIVEQTSAEARRLFDERVGELLAFAEQRRLGLERLRGLRFAPAFAEPRPGQETAAADLRAAAGRSPVVLFEAPTGFGKTGCVLEYALGELAGGRLTRAIYLTGKSTGQIQAVRQLEAMAGRPPGAAWWQIRNKAEHCVNDVYHCFRDACGFLDGCEARWPSSGLQRFGQDAALPRDLETLREAGRRERICPYEVTRASLPFADVWIGDYNYVFAPANRGFLAELPGFEPAQTLLVIDEAHNLPARAADAHSSELSYEAGRAALGALHYAGAPAALAAAWERLVVFLGRLEPCDALPPEVEAEAGERLGAVARLLQQSALDWAALGPGASETVFGAAALHASRESGTRRLPELVWVPSRGLLAFTCLDAAEAIADTLRPFGHALFLSATLAPIDVFARQCGLDRLGLPIEHLAARTPWRDAACDVAIDARVDTRFERRARHYSATAAAAAALHAAGSGPVVVFFSSYAYAERILALLEADHPQVRAVLQPRTRELAAQHRFIDEALAFTDIILLVLGSSFSESIDLLGGRVTGAMVVGPALPEVNAVQRAKIDASRAPNRDAAFREVYLIPGLQKVNQALGRLVRAPGQHARVLLHCRRFAEPGYHALLAPEYRDAAVLADDRDFEAWLAGRPR